MSLVVPHVRPVGRGLPSVSRVIAREPKGESVSSMWSEGASVAFDLFANGDPKVGRTVFEAFGLHQRGGSERRRERGDD